MNAQRVFQVQELCDSISEYVDDSKWDLRSCSLLSRSFTSAAQRRLFHDVIFNRGCYGIDEPGILDRVDEAGACKRLCDVLRASPHILPLVRRIRGAFELEVLQLLSEIEFPHLRTLVLHRRRLEEVSAQMISYAARLVATPSLQRVGFVYPVFASMGDLNRLFEKHTPNLASLFVYNAKVKTRTPPKDITTETKPTCRILVKNLRCAESHSQDRDWLFDVDCPFEFAHVEELDCGSYVTSTVSEVVSRSRNVLTRLKVDANFIHDSIPDLLSPSCLPVLAHLTITSTGRKVRDVATLLSAIPTAPSSVAEGRLNSLVIHIRTGNLDHDGLRAVADVCLNLTCTVTVKITFSRMREMEAVIRDAFAALVGQGRLNLVAA